MSVAKINDLDLRQLRYFVEVAEQRSYAEAAVSLGVTASAITQGIIKLEEKVGVRLLERGRFGALPTDAGRMLLDRARLVTAEVNLAVEELRELRGEKNLPRVRIGIGRSLADDFFPEVLASVVSKHPNLIVTVVEGWSSDLYRGLLRGDLDFVVSMPLPQLEIDTDLIQEVLFQQSERVVIGTRHPLAALPVEAVTMARLSGELWLTPLQGNARIRVLQRLFQDCQLDPPRRFLRTDSTGVGTGLVKEGAVVGQGVLEVVQRYLSTDEYRVLPIPELSFERTVLLARRKRGRLQSPALVLKAEVQAAAALRRDLRKQGCMSEA